MEDSKSKCSSFLTHCGVLLLGIAVCGLPSFDVLAADPALTAQPALQSTGAPSFVEMSPSESTDQWDMTRLDQIGRQLEEQSREMALRQQGLVQAARH